MHDKPKLRIDWASHEAARYACENWHYSKSIPAGKLVKVGVWENDKFIGVVLFGRGANQNLSNAYGLPQDEACELVRIALTKHGTPVSKVMAIAIRFLKKTNPRLRLIVSYADPQQGHHGGIYQATNWLYAGKTKPQASFILNGKQIHKRSVMSKYKTNSLEKLQGMGLDIAYSEKTFKHIYLMPLDAEMVKQIQLLSKPYPKRVKEQS